MEAKSQDSQEEAKSSEPSVESEAPVSETSSAIDMAEKKNKRSLKIGLIISGILFIIIIAGIIWQITYAKSLTGGSGNQVRTIGILQGVSEKSFDDIVLGFKNKMTELNYEEGENIVYDWQKADSESNTEENIINKFIKDKVDLIIAFPTRSALTAKKLTSDTSIPVVFVLSNTEGNGLIESIGNPGGNITGVRDPGTANTVKRFEILHELAPDAESVYLVYKPDYPTTKASLEALQESALTLDLELIKVPVEVPSNIEKDLLEADLVKKGTGTILLFPDPTTSNPVVLDKLMDFANENKFAVAGTSIDAVEGGILFSYLPLRYDMGSQVAPLVDKVFKGAQAGEISVVTPESQLVVSLKQAKALGLTIPDGLLNIAKEILE